MGRSGGETRNVLIVEHQPEGRQVVNTPRPLPGGNPAPRTRRMVVIPLDSATRRDDVAIPYRSKGIPPAWTGGRVILPPPFVLRPNRTPAGIRESSPGGMTAAKSCDPPPFVIRGFRTARPVGRRHPKQATQFVPNRRLRLRQFGGRQVSRRPFPDSRPSVRSRVMAAHFLDDGI